METLYAIYNLGHFVKRGFLYGPICPIYGYGALMLIIFFNKYQKHNFKLFICSAVVFSAFEYFVSYILDAMFAMHWWDYTNEFFNLNGRISIFYSFDVRSYFQLFLECYTDIMGRKIWGGYVAGSWRSQRTD